MHHLAVLALLFVAIRLSYSVESTPSSTFDSQVPMIFVFGDSFVDSGNNNYLNTSSKANHTPYGVNFDGNRATGRWSDGRIVTDYLANYLGIRYPPPFLDNSNITLGANFGSAGSGILNTTQIGGEVINFSQQVEDFVEHRRRLNSILGRRLAQYFTTRSIFYINIGNNDINNYVQEHNATITPAFRANLLNVVRQKIQRLYRHGARKIVITSAFALGCAPMYQIQGVCEATDLEAADYYNEGLLATISNLHDTNTELHIVYANTHDLLLDVHENPAAHGFVNATHPCCPTIDRPSQRWCVVTDSYCTNPRQYLFWDTAHPSGAFNRLAARRFWSGSRRYTIPYNIQTLAAI